MAGLLAVIVCLLASLEPVNGQRGLGTAQPWIQGSVAVVVFLVLTGVAFVINKIWCQKNGDSFDGNNKELSMRRNKEELAIPNGTEGKFSTTVADFRCVEGSHVYENKVELECGNTTEVCVENPSQVITTAM
ncbi:PDZK1-interacting protein 1 [Tiliqua scincoides]|uniref:PDZK1-interacting protein 1 n=1 Tax=Tiliqua scincoides TaxID=71010 RepID=UPI003462DB3E